MQRYSALVAAVLLVGCGGGGPNDMPEVGAVTGTVTIDGQPGANLMVTFQPEGGRPSMGATDASGKYELTYSREAMGAKIGKNLVTISSVQSDAAYEAGETEAAATDDAEPAEDPIPAKYNTMAVDNPDMTVEVKPGENTFNWDVVTTE